MSDPVTPQIEAFFWFLDHPVFSAAVGVISGYFLAFTKPTWLRVTAVIFVALAPLAWEIAFGGTSAFGLAITLLIVSPIWVALLLVGLLINRLIKRAKPST